MTDACLADVIKLFSIVCIKPNHCPTSLYKFKQFFSKLDIEIKKHYYCTECTVLVNNSVNDVDNDEVIENDEFVTSDRSCNCDNNDKKDKYFLEVPLIDQLESLYVRKGFYNSLKKKPTAANNCEQNTYNDINDGYIYKNLSNEKQILSYYDNLAFMWYTDGVLIFKHSKFNIWGYFLIILQLPFSERYKIENMLLVALWFGDKKPVPSLFLDPLKLSLKKVFQGIKVFVTDLQKEIIIRGITICGTCDLPAKALFLNMNQYNGNFGCQVCKEKGKTVEKRHVYPYKENLRLRTDEETLEHASQAVETKRTVCGVKGPSAMSLIVYKPVISTAVDLMHGAFSGNAKRLMELLFDQKFSDEPFSMSNLVDVVDYRLCNIKPPLNTQRRPRPIKTHFSLWKTSEFKNWTLYYSVVVLNELMDKDYFDHYMYFVLSIYMLCQEKVTNEMVNKADELLREFVSRFEHLYGEKYMSCNLHNLRHLPEMVRRFGPLWTTSCFPLEDINGKLKAMVHGSKAPHLQICSNLNIHITVYSLKHIWLKQGSVGYNFCEKILSSKKQLRLTSIGQFLFIVGTVKKLPNHQSIELSLKYNLVDKNIFSFERLKKSKIIYTTKLYSRDKKNASYVVKYLNQNESLIGVIDKFIRLTECDCKKCCECPGTHWALIKKLDIHCPFRINLNSILYFIHELKETENFELISVTKLIHVCNLIHVESSEKYFAVEAVNNVECE